MKLLLDAHALLWWVDQDQLLSAPSRTAIADRANEVLISAGTIWEIAIKVGSGKLSLSMPYCSECPKRLPTLARAFFPSRRSTPTFRPAFPNTTATRSTGSLWLRLDSTTSRS